MATHSHTRTLPPLSSTLPHIATPHLNDQTTTLPTTPLPHTKRRRPNSLPVSHDPMHSDLTNIPPLDMHLPIHLRQGLWPSSTPPHATRPDISTLTLIDKYITSSQDTANPDLDIHPTGSHTIQIGTTTPDMPTHVPPYPHGLDHANSPHNAWQNNTAFIYRPNGSLVGCLPIPRLLALKTSYDTSIATLPQSLIHKYSLENFPSDLSSLLSRYPPPKDNCPPPYQNAYWTLPPHLVTNSILNYGITHIHFATPLTIPLDQHNIS